MFVVICFAIIPLLILFCLLRIFLSAEAAYKAIFGGVVIIALEALVTLTGLLVNVFYEPDTYWHTITLSSHLTDTWLSNTTTIGQMLLVPYTACADLACWWWEIMTTHFSIGLLVPHLIGLYIVDCWYRIYRGCSAARNDAAGWNFKDNPPEEAVGA